MSTANCIDYENYLVFPYTVKQLSKNYTQDVLDRYGNQLAFLYQNGFRLNGNHCMECVEDQMYLFNDFETYDDFEDLKKTTAELIEPSPIGYKIVDDLLESVLKKTGWALKDLYDIKSLGDIYSDIINKCCNILTLIVNSHDFEIEKVAEIIFDDESRKMLDDCIYNLQNGKKNVALVMYQRLYKKLIKVHWKIVKGALSNSNEKGMLSRIGNINDELYGSAGNYNPNNGEVVSYGGSAVRELKKLCNKDIESTDLNVEMAALCKECKANGETNRYVLEFANMGSGMYYHWDELRKVLTDICFNGILVLVTLKHGLSLDENDTMNSKKAEKIMREISAICKYTGYFFSEAV